MSNVNNEVAKRKLYEYDSGFGLISPWTSSKTVERDSGATMETEIKRLEDKVEGIIDDDDVYSATTWSSKQITDAIAAQPQINDSIVSDTTLWSSQKAASIRMHFKILSASGKSGDSATLPMFDGFFAIVRAEADYDVENRGIGGGIIGVVDPWGGITYLSNNAYDSETETGIATMEMSGNNVVVTNHTNMYIIVYYFTTAG